MEYPEYIARFYDLIYVKLRNSVDHDFFMKKIKDSRGPVLEVGVGTGRFFTDALNRGIDIYGIDTSVEMLRVLKKKIKKSEYHRISRQDVVSMKLDRKFNLIIAPFRVFSHLLEIQDQLQALDRIYEHLDPGGEFIFDVFVPDLALLLNGVDNFTDFDGEHEPGKILKRIITAKSDLVNQVSHVKMKFIWDIETGKAEKEWDFKFRFYFRYELEHLIARSKLTLSKVFGDYKGNPLGEDSKEFVVVCKRADEAF
jgi:SAM-dependent methyltransferase